MFKNILKGWLNWCQMSEQSRTEQKYWVTHNLQAQAQCICMKTIQTGKKINVYT